MKKAVVFTTLFIAFGLYAQEDEKSKLRIEKGTWNLDGSFSIGFSDFENSFQTETQNPQNNFETFRFDIAPQLGYAVKKNFLVGIGIAYGQSTSETINSNDSIVSRNTEDTNRSLSLFPFARLFFPVGEKFAFSVQGELRYTRDFSEATDRIMEVTFKEFNGDSIFIGVRPGLTYFISDHFALESRLGSLGYRKSQSETTREPETRNRDSSEQELFSFDLNSADIFFGLSYYF